MYPECRHIMPNGAKCHSPAMRAMAYCYFHTPERRSAQGRAQKKPLKLPALDDRAAIQIAAPAGRPPEERSLRTNAAAERLELKTGRMNSRARVLQAKSQ